MDNYIPNSFMIHRIYNPARVFATPGKNTSKWSEEALKDERQLFYCLINVLGNAVEGLLSTLIHPSTFFLCFTIFCSVFVDLT